MASVEKRSGAYRVKYRDSLGRQKSRSFDRKLDVDRVAREVEVDKDRGAWLDPRDAEIPVAEWAKRMGVCRSLGQSRDRVGERPQTSSA